MGENEQVHERNEVYGWLFGGILGQMTSADSLQRSEFVAKRALSGLGTFGWRTYFSGREAKSGASGFRRHF